MLKNIKSLKLQKKKQAKQPECIFQDEILFYFTIYTAQQSFNEISVDCKYRLRGEQSKTAAFNCFSTR